MSLFDVPGWSLGALRPPSVLSNRKLKKEKRNKRKAEEHLKKETDEVEVVLKRQKVDEQQPPKKKKKKVSTRERNRILRKEAQEKEGKGPESENTATDIGKEEKQTENKKTHPNKKDKALGKDIATSDSPEKPDVAAATNQKQKANGDKKNQIKKDKVPTAVETESPKQPDVAAGNKGLEEKATGNKKKQTERNKIPETVIETSGPKQADAISIIKPEDTKPVTSTAVPKGTLPSTKPTSTAVPKGTLPSTKPLSKNDKKKLLQSLQRGKERQTLVQKPQPVSSSSKIDAPTVTETEGFVRTSQVSQNDTLTRLQQEMQKKLKGAKFRWLNEQLYTTSGEEGFKLFNAQPELFDIYHTGFRSQVESWPTNPLDIMIGQLKQASEDLIVADMGCGEARLSISVPQKVHSFDLVAANERIVACDVKHVPLPDEHVDVVVFCLALMGTNYLDFLKEAHRIMKNGGELKIAEVTSRITDVKAFVNSLSTLGFTLVEKDMSNSHFILFRFTKSVTAGKQNGKKPTDSKNTSEKTAVLKPCIYKRR